MPDNRNIHTTSHSAIAAVTTYRTHSFSVFGSVRFAMPTLYRFHLLWAPCGYPRAMPKAAGTHQIWHKNDQKCL